MSRRPIPPPTFAVRLAILMLRLRTARELWKKSSKLDAQTQHAMETLKAAQRTVSTTMDRDTASGLRAAREIAEELALDGYFGPLYELFEVDDRYKTAVEVTAGTRSAFFEENTCVSTFLR